MKRAHPAYPVVTLALIAGTLPALGRAADPVNRPPVPATRPAGPETTTAATAQPPATRPVPLTPGDTRRELTVGGRKRSYLVHVPPAYDPAEPTPVVLAFHGALMNGAMMVQFTGLSRKADDAGFVVVYPDGTGFGGPALFFNASAAPGPNWPADDVAFTAALLDDLAAVVTVDPKRVFATGLSNGGMMCHRLAAELADRIAAVAPVGGTLALPAVNPKRPVPVMHFHGTADAIVPFDGPRGRTPATMRFRSVGDTIKAWVAANGCPPEPIVTALPDVADDDTTVRQQVYGPGKAGAEVVLVEIAGGGHTWPGRQPALGWIGRSTSDVSANDLMWTFFQRHPMK
jgi:polyhydroxybutyrate depolymerase